MMLTKKQRTLLDFIDRFVNSHGFSPSFEEMKDAMGMKSKSGIHRLLGALEERGYIRKLPHRARCIEVVSVSEHERFLQSLSPSLRYMSWKAQCQIREQAKSEHRSANEIIARYAEQAWRAAQ